MFHSVTTMTSVVRGTRGGLAGGGKEEGGWGKGGGARMSPALVPTTDVRPCGTYHCATRSVCSCHSKQAFILAGLGNGIHMADRQQMSSFASDIEMPPPPPPTSTSHHASPPPPHSHTRARTHTHTHTHTHSRCL